MSKLLLILVLFALLVFAIVRWQKGQYDEFIKCAAKVSAVINKKEERNVHPSTGAGRIENIISYSYLVDKTYYTAEDTVEYSDIWLELKEGQELEIYYSKKDPQISHPVIVMDRRIGGAPPSFGSDCK